MGRSASIVINVSTRESWSADVVNWLIKTGWSYNDRGHISYLPLGDTESFDWQWVDLNLWPMVSDVMKQKEALGELIGLVVVWEAAGSGGEVLLDPSAGSILFSLTIDRQCIDRVSEVTDFTWYLARILPALASADLFVESIKCTEDA